MKGELIEELQNAIKDNPIDIDNIDLLRGPAGASGSGCGCDC
ncbi:hypothetical protein [Sporanaerobacter acetigenes]|uniref:Uncharacterized protein n=1 Tax=Sporanaerobacter acetigenes DSM 13106 TaxID=1123281 RepID=A0A1M5ZAQ6_9FIRM|nr:hypothetical protein [Sporanaerobacter acetigenes]SHI21321.1 hypothetical protein SAMN02745180_02915 [Sporanaerobacter acetigenes DSM 13106]